MKVSTLNQRHPSLKGDDLCIRRALYEGGKAWRRVVGRLLPQHEAEPADAYQKRLEHATYENHAGPILDLMTGTLFSEAPRIEPDDAEVPDHVAYWKRLEKQVSSAGDGWARWWRDRMTEALWSDRTWVWLDLPRAAPAASVADQVRSGSLDVVLRSIDPESVLDWAEDDRGLGYIRFRTVVREVELDGVSEARDVWVWTVINRTQIRRFRWRPEPGQSEPGPDDEAQEEPPILHGWSDETGRPMCPVIPVGLPKGLEAGSRMQDPAIAHLRSRTELGWSLFRAAVLILYVKSRFVDDAKRPTLGQGTYLALEHQDEVGWLEPTGAAFGALSTDVAERRAALYRVVHQMAVTLDATASRSAQTAESKGMDWKAAEVVLTSLATVTLDAMRRTVEAIARLRGALVPKVSGLESWQREDTGAFLEQVAMAPELKRSPTAVRLIAMEQARRILQDATPEDLAEIAAELEAAVALDTAPAWSTRGTPPDPAGPPGAGAGAAG